jgi:hypothetical protein
MPLRLAISHPMPFSFRTPQSAIRISPFNPTSFFSRQERTNAHRIALLIGVFSVVWMLWTRPAQATTIEWANVGSTWATGSNWVGGTAPADSTVTDIASFGSTGVSPINPNLTAQRSINGIIFLSGAYSYTIGGSIITIGGSGISNSATNTETFSNGIRTSTSQT